MFQRIQTVYLILSALVMGILPNLLPLYTLSSGIQVFYTHNTGYIILFMAVTALSVINIFGYKNRKNQFVVNRIAILLNFLLLGIMVYRSLNLSGETLVSEKGIGMILPVVSIFLLSFANKAIKRDEDLVKSVDRIR